MFRCQFIHIFFLLLLVFCVSYLRSHCWIQGHKDLYLCIHHRIFSFYSYICILFTNLLNVYLFFERESTSGEGTERNRDTESEAGCKALSCQQRARCRAWTHKPWDHDLSWSWTFNQLSHPGAPTFAYLIGAHLCIWYKLVVSTFILLHVDVQFSLNHLLKRLFFPSQNGLGIPFKYQVTKMWEFQFNFCNFNSYTIDLMSTLKNASSAGS